MRELNTTFSTYHVLYLVPLAASHLLPQLIASLLTSRRNRLGWDPEDKSTWARERTNMPKHRTVNVSDYAPKAWQAICELSGGEDRVTEESNNWNDGFIINLGTPEHEGQEEHPKKLPGWHVDGDFFVHFLDSPEQGLLVIPLFTDIVPNGGGTWIASDGIPVVAKWLVRCPYLIRSSQFTTIHYPYASSISSSH